MKDAVARLCRSSLVMLSASVMALVLIVPASAAPPTLRLIIVVAIKVKPPAPPPSPLCVASRARATVSAFGIDRWGIRRVQFLLDGRLVSADQTTPYQLLIRRADLAPRASVELLARVEMRDGRRAELKRILRRC